MSGMERIYEKLFADHLRHNRQMLFVSGPRQVGKTTLAKLVLPEGRYFNYDRTSDALLFAKGPDGLAETLGFDQPSARVTSVIFDEIHKYWQWKRFVKGFFDVYGTRVKIVATGSARMDVYRRGGDSLMGRYFGYRVHPLTIGELASPAVDLESVFQSPKDLGAVDIPRLMEFGGYPEPFLNGTRRFYNRWQNSRLDKIFAEDLRDLSRVQDLRGVRALSELLTARVTGEISYVSLARDLGVTADTVKSWIGLLEGVYFCYEIRPYFRNVANSIRKTPKIYLWDWSLLSDPGARAENFVASHLLKSVDWWTDSGLGRFELAYIRDKQQHEVDFVIVRDAKPFMLLECKMSAKEPMSACLKSFAAKLKVPYAYQVAIDAQPSVVNPLEFRNEPVRIAFADLAKVMI